MEPLFGDGELVEALRLRIGDLVNGPKGPDQVVGLGRRQGKVLVRLRGPKHGEWLLEPTETVDVTGRWPQ